MSKHDDSALLEAVRTHRERLRGAFLAGSHGTRRSISTLTGKVMGSIVLAAVAVAVCVGVAFVLSVLPQARGGTSSAPVPASSSPSPTSAAETGTNP